MKTQTQSPPDTRFWRIYKKIFSVHEIENDITLKWFLGAVLLGFHATYKTWIGNPSTTLEALENKSYTCWPFAQTACENFRFLSTLPDGYSQPFVFMVLFGVMIACVYAMYRQKWHYAHLAILFLFIWKFYFLFLTFEHKQNYNYYHTIFCLVLLFLPHKKFFAQLAFVSFYFLSTATKIHPGWTLGTYFTSLKTGLPIFPDITTTFWTNLVIFMEMVAAWFLFSKNWVLQRLVLLFFITFHLYSGLLVYYHYPTIVLPSLIILFGPWFTPWKKIPLDLKSITGWVLITLIFVIQSLSHFIAGDEKLTLEGNFYGLYMFEANHQCRIQFFRENGDSIASEVRLSARRRCDPYGIWFRKRNKFCTTFEDEAVGMVLDHSINGGPFHRIIDEPDICNLTYTPFRHNSWIKTTEEAPIIARPHQNIYW